MSNKYDVLSDPQWRQHEDFFDHMMTVAAVDRLIHHATIIEIGGDSYRRKEAMKHKEALTRTSIIPEATTITPDAVSITPEVATITPDAVSITPEVASITPDAASITPETASITPDAASMTSAPATTPFIEVGRPAPESHCAQQPDG